MQAFAHLVPSPDARRPLSYQTFVEDLLPPLLCYYATAVLILLPDTILIRLALLPVTLWTIFRASTTVDLVKSFNDERLIYWNHGLLLATTTMAMRVLAWTFQLHPYERVRISCPDKASKDEPRKSINPLHIARDAFDLFINLRGCDWDWSPGLQVPRETRSSSRFAFVAQTFASAILHIILFDNFLYSVQAVSPSTIGSPDGGSIFDATLPPLTRYLRSSTICLFSGLTIYSGIQAAYDMLTIVGVIVFFQHPRQWPPLFDAPWKSTSLNEFWTKRWHQLFRHQFISVGGKLGYYLLGRLGAVMGVFLMSGILHDFGMWGMGRGAEFSSMGGYFLMMGVGVAAEGLWKKVTGIKVQGRIGWIWTTVWVIGWANILVDAWARRGLIGSMFLLDWQRPSRYLLGLVI